MRRVNPTYCYPLGAYSHRDSNNKIGYFSDYTCHSHFNSR